MKQEVVFGEHIEVEKTDKVVVVVVPYEGGLLKCIGYSTYGYVEGIILVNENHHTDEDDWYEADHEEIQFIEYEGYSVTSVSVQSNEIWVTLVNLEKAYISLEKVNDLLKDYAEVKMEELV